MHWVAVYLDKVGIVDRLYQRVTVVVVQVDVGVYSIVKIIFIYKLTRYLQVTIL